MTRLSTRRGFTLVELMVTMVLLGVLGAVFTRVIIQQGRFYDRENARRNARAVARNSMNVILSDLRMVQDTLGLESISSDGRSITVRVPYRFGLVCLATGSAVVASMLPVDSAVVGMAQYAGYAIRNPNGFYQTYMTGTSLPSQATNASACTGNSFGEAQIATVSIRGKNGQVLALVPGALALPGSSIFFWQRITYSFQPSGMMPGNGRWGLFRQVGGRAAEELMAPFDGRARFRPYFRGDDTSRTTYTLADTALIKGLDIVLTGRSERVPTGQSAPTTTRMVSSVFFKNVRRF